MNLLYAAWLPFRCRNGALSWRPLSAITDPELVDFALPRADFQGAAYQFAIGVLQTVFAPRDSSEWHNHYLCAPSQEVLVAVFQTIAHAFALTGDGPLFMQDYDPLTQQALTPVSGLLIDAPGANGLKNNTDFFVKRSTGDIMSPAMAAMALFTLQINAPSGGAGHRVGLRGGGPLTTLVLPEDANSPLWQKLWLNVINRDKWRYCTPDLHDGSVFPWLAPTHESSKQGSEIYPISEGIHPLQAYWAMPRRIQLVIDESPAVCQISGELGDCCVRHFRTKNYGNNYVGNWDPHPFTPYSWNPKKLDDDHLPLKGRSGGINYKIWMIMTLTNHYGGHVCARVIDHYLAVTQRKLLEESQLWVFGYDMDNMKPRGWYSTSMPLFAVDDDCHDVLLSAVRQLQELATQSLFQTRSQIKAAWFDKPGDAKGDTGFIDFSFWQRTEKAFYLTVSQLAANINQQQVSLSPEQARQWRNTIQNVCEQLFDQYALDELRNVRTMAKSIRARNALTSWLYSSKTIKEFNHNYLLNERKDTQDA